MKGRAASWVGLAVVAVALAGCLGDAKAKYLEGAFTVDAPPWAAGYSWTYVDRERSTSTVSGLEFERSTTEAEPPQYVSLQVFNTTKRLDGDAVYFASVTTSDAWPATDAPDETPTYPGLGPLVAMHAYRQSDLAWVAYGQLYSEYARPEPVSVAYDAAYPASVYYQPSNTLYLRSEPELPQWEFPLHEGQSWTPALDGEEGLAFSARTLGRQLVDVGGVERETVHVRVVGYVSAEAGDEAFGDFVGAEARDAEGAFTVTFTGDYWWGVQEANLARSVERYEYALRAAWTTPEGAPARIEGHAAAERERTLLEYALTDAPETPVPVYAIAGRSDPDLDHVRALHVTLSGGPPFDVGAGPIDLEYYLAKTPYGYLCSEYGSAASAACPGAAQTYNETRFEARWSLDRLGDDEPLATGTGARFDATVDEPGPYRARVAFYDRDFDTIAATSSWTTAVSWTREVLVEREPSPGPPVPGAAGVVDVVAFTIPAAGAELFLDYEMRADVAPDRALDEGQWVLETPAGPYELPPGDDDGLTLHFTEAGEYVLSWAPARAVTVGDDAWAHVRISYPYYYGSY